MDDRDPLWLGLCCLAAISVVVGLVLLLSSERGSTEHSVAWLCVLPCAALGLAGRVRAENGNVTERLRQVISREATPQPRRYSRAFTAYLIVAYAFVVVVTVASYGLSPVLLVLIVGQGLVTAFVLGHTSWERTFRDEHRE